MKKRICWFSKQLFFIVRVLMIEITMEEINPVIINNYAY